MFLKKWALWANEKKSHRDILTIESTKVTLHFGYIFKFLDRCAKSQQRAKNGNFQNLFFKLSTHNCRYSHETSCNDWPWCPIAPVKISVQYLNPNRFYIKKYIFENFPKFQKALANLLATFHVFEILTSIFHQSMSEGSM
jgi:hypothetical protein